MEKYCFGVDVGGTTVKIGLFRDDLQMVSKWEIPTRTEENGRNIIPDIADSIKQEMKDKELKPENVLGIGIGIPGPVLEESVVNNCVNLGWGVVNVKKELSSQLYYLPVKAGNDANVAALGEAVAGAGEGRRNVVMLTLGTGLGGGVIIDGNIHAGAHGAAGEFGHMPMFDKAVDYCGCGKRGCAEQIAGAKGMISYTRHLIAGGESRSGLSFLREFTARDIFDFAKDGDELANTVVNEMVETLGKTLSVLGAAFDPEVFIIGGGMSRAGEWLLEKIRASYEEKAFHAVKNTEIIGATLGNDAGMTGAAALIIKGLS
ncbi:MAG: ROK family glucokinase [Lachnospiraceae bacterium]|nr:ROK family glucokinase [Lachnospiraceae bacterium]